MCLRSASECYLYQILSLFYNANQFVDYGTACKPYKSTTLEYIKTVIEYIENNYFSAITVSDLAKNANINQYYLMKIFKQVIGTSPIDYLINLRIEYAAKLLKGGYSITQIANEVGFNNTSYFITKFKQKHGMTPKEYRKSNFS